MLRPGFQPPAACRELEHRPYRAAMSIGHFLTFASEAEIIALWGLGFIGIALVATLAEIRRNRRRRIDGVGWVPWRAIFLTSAIIGGGLMLLAMKGLLAG